jgi:hypothetical protein
MAPFVYPFAFLEDDSSEVSGVLELDPACAYNPAPGRTAYFRTGTIQVKSCPTLSLVLYHNKSTAKFMYLRKRPMDENLLSIVGLTNQEIEPETEMMLPGQLCLGSARGNVIGAAIQDVIGSPAIAPAFQRYHQHNMAIFPIAREGLKYQVNEAIHENYGYYCDEIILDAHHVFDSSVPIYNRKVEMTLFKDKELDRSQKENISVAFIADSIASGLVMKEVIERVKERFDRLQQVEVIAPLATIRGLCRVASSRCTQDTNIRVHVFETLLNALPPDFYYSAHYNIPEFHIEPELEADYRAWWGVDGNGQMIADTACAGYGWSEVFFSPRKQIEMMNSQLISRHQMTIADIVRRNIPVLP